MSSGTFSVSSGFESDCADTFLSTAIAADSCIVDGVFSYKLQLTQGKYLRARHVASISRSDSKIVPLFPNDDTFTDSCAGAVVQYFFDDACHLFAGSSNLAANVKACTVSYHDNKNRAVYTSLTCSAEAVHITSALDILAA